MTPADHNVALEKENQELRAKIEWLEEQLAYLQRKLYGRSSEKEAPVEDGQTDLFDDGVFDQPEKTGHQIPTTDGVRHPQRKSHQAQVTKELPIKKEIIK